MKKWLIAALLVVGALSAGGVLPPFVEQLVRALEPVVAGAPL